MITTGMISNPHATHCYRSSAARKARLAAHIGCDAVAISLRDGRRAPENWRAESRRLSVRIDHSTNRDRRDRDVTLLAASIAGSDVGFHAIARRFTRHAGI